MVKNLFFLFFLLPFSIFSGEFTASVNRNQVNFGESLTLNLTLKEAVSKGPPSVESLKKQFSINSQQQLLNTVMINGQITTSTIWKFTLVPQKEGELIIPSIGIETAEGALYSNSITIQVVKGTPTNNADATNSNDLILTTEISNATPYKNEPLTYTVRIVTKRDLADIRMQNLVTDHAIVEANSQPKIYHKTIDGINVGIIELDYLITPLKAGSLKIPSTSIQGVMIAKKARHGSFFDDDFDPFSMMQGFERLQPFSLSTEELTIDVQPAIPGIHPWLPARTLIIEETWNEKQTLQVGEPFNIGYRISAEGIKSNQLPNLNEQLSNSKFKIYADKPELIDEGKGINFKSSRKEQYTLIPQEAGTLILPELSIVWWDVIKNEKVTTHVPARIFQILPAPVTISQPENKNVSIVESAVSSSVVNTQPNWILYAAIIGLTLLLLLAILWGIILRKKMIKLTAEEHPNKYRKDSNLKRKSPKSDKREKLPDLNPT